MAACEGKSEIRARVLTERRRLLVEDIKRGSEAVCRLILELGAYRDAESICGYAAMPDEVQLAEVLRKANEDGKRVLLPAFDGTQYLFRKWQPTIGMRAGFGGVLEPEGGGYVMPESGSLILTPGLAFDPSGRRLGFGGGWYDRLIGMARSSCERLDVYGVCFDLQIQEHIPTEAHDQGMDGVVTDRRVFIVDNHTEKPVDAHVG